MPFFETIDTLEDDPIFGIAAKFAADPRPNKVNLNIGAYKDDEGKSLVLNAVREAEALLLQKNLSKDYQPIDGTPDYLKETLALCIGENHPDLNSGRVIPLNTLGGTSALRIGGELIATLISPAIFITDPTWPNHFLLFRKAGLTTHTYTYYDPVKNSLDFDGMCKSIKEMPPGSAILLQACCHNPTGIDPTPEQWKTLSQLILKQKLFPFFDFAYQGFGKGVEEDGYAIRLFIEDGHEFFVASSYSKNFGLYGERVGSLFAFTQDKASAAKLLSHFKQIIRGMYSTAPLHGGRIVSTILSNSNLRNGWLEELGSMRMRIQEMRSTLLADLQTKGLQEFDFLTHQKGMFSYSGLNQRQVEILRHEFAIYMPENGRINVAGLNAHNMNRVTNAILEVMKR